MALPPIRRAASRSAGGLRGTRSAWLRWRSDQVTALLARLRQAMRRSCPGVKLSLAPNPRDFSYRSSLADWSDWVRRGLADELVVQIYRWDTEAVARELADAGLRQAQRRVPLRIGLLAGLRGRPKDREQLRRELALVRRQGFEGIDLFFYESVRPHLPLLPWPGEAGEAVAPRHP